MPTKRITTVRKHKRGKSSVKKHSRKSKGSRIKGWHKRRDDKKFQMWIAFDGSSISVETLEGLQPVRYRVMWNLESIIRGAEVGLKIFFKKKEAVDWSLAFMRRHPRG